MNTDLLLERLGDPVPESVAIAMKDWSRYYVGEPWCTCQASRRIKAPYFVAPRDGVVVKVYPQTVRVRREDIL